MRTDNGLAVSLSTFAKQHLPVPEDFEEMFVRTDWISCEELYAVGRDTIEHWVEIVGEAVLKKQRQAYFRRCLADVRRRPCPPDFDITYIHLGASACSKRYRAGHERIERWLNERGRERLEQARAEYLDPRKLTRRDIGRILSAAYPVQSSTLPRGE